VALSAPGIASAKLILGDWLRRFAALALVV
jgi:hypothetical protein